MFRIFDLRSPISRGKGYGTGVSTDIHSVGGVPIPVDRRRLNQMFWSLAGILVFYLVFFNDSKVATDRLGMSLLMVFSILMPLWFWVSNRAQGLPIFPLYALFFFPTYAIPLCRGDSRFAQYTETQIANGVFTISGYLILSSLIWWQCCNRNLRPSPKVRALDPKTSKKIMIFFLGIGLLFELFGMLTGKQMSGAYQALRGYSQNASRLAIFVLFYEIGRKELNPVAGLMVCLMTAGLVIRQMASIVLANSFPTMGLAFAGFFLGSGKVPWKSLGATIAMIVLLHSGKAEMRSIYYKEGVTVGVFDYPAFFMEWMGRGVVGLTRGASTEGLEVQNAKERAALLPLLLQIQKMSGRDVPFLDGASYENLPSMLVPRILSKEKAVSHISNMIMAVHYGILTVENVWFTSIAFDLPMEAYANYGYSGVVGLAVVMGLFLGLISLMTTGVPLFSLRFLMAILVLSAVVSSNNTMGVFVTTVWQGFLALYSLSFLIMKTISNPLYVKSGKMAGGGRVVVEGSGIKDQGMAGGGPSSLPATTEPGEKLGKARGYGLQATGEAGHSPSTQGLGGREAPVRHERPTRFVYGPKKKD